MANILVTEDDEEVQEVLADMLEDEGHEVQFAESAAKAQRLLRRPFERKGAREFDLLILDIELEGQVNGFELLKAIKTDTKYKKLRSLPVIMVSSNRGDDAAIKALENDAEDYLTKPVSLAQLLARVNLSLRTLALHRRYVDAVNNIFPEEIVDGLIEGELPPPKFYSSATVLFTDFVGFTRSAAELAEHPQRLLNGLNTFFSGFDRIVSRCNVRKIKTIGDAYMCAGGVPAENRTHAVDAVRSALEMRGHVRWLNRHAKEDDVCWPMRIGIHTGPLTAGVIGKQGFRSGFDLWGDTVNIASRLESSGEADEISVSEAVRQCTAEFFDFEGPEKIDLKGKGELERFLVTGVKPDLRAVRANRDEASTGMKFHIQRRRLADADQAAAAGS